MRHQKKGRKLKRTSSHKKALLGSLATALFEHKRISTTEAKAKELRSFAEKLITKAKHAVMREKQGLLPEGQTVDIHNRRIVYKFIRKKAVLQELFDTIAPMVVERPGGYTRIVKTGQRRGDGSYTAIIEMVDWSSPQDGATDLKTKKKAKSKRSKKTEVTKAEDKKAVKQDKEVIDETNELLQEDSVIEETKEISVEDSAEQNEESVESETTESTEDVNVADEYKEETIEEIKEEVKEEVENSKDEGEQTNTEEGKSDKEVTDETEPEESKDNADDKKD